MPTLHELSLYVVIYGPPYYRCLVPDSHKEPEKWKTYDMHGYRAAFNKTTLAEVDTFKYDNNFLNWIDPEVHKKYTTDPVSTWKESYGYPFVNVTRWDGVDRGTFDTSLCWWRCASMVRTNLQYAYTASCSMLN